MPNIKTTKCNWLILGASGLLGWNLCHFLEGKGQKVVGTYNTHPLQDQEGLRFISLDIFKDPVRKLEQINFKPDFIVNTLALTDVDECEKRPDLAHKLNCESVCEALKLCAQFNHTKLIQISTDQVHNGTRGAFKEDDPVSPVNIYGKTKIAGEQLALESNRSLVCRSNFYGPGLAWRSSFSDWIISNLKQKNELTLFTDSIFNPLEVKHLSNAIFELATGGHHGLFHTCGKDYLSKYDFAIKLAQHLDLDTKLIKPTLLKDKRLLAPRPLNMTLDIHKLEKALDRNIEGVQEGIQSLIT